MPGGGPWTRAMYEKWVATSLGTTSVDITEHVENLYKYVLYWASSLILTISGPANAREKGIGDNN